MAASIVEHRDVRLLLGLGALALVLSGVTAVPQWWFLRGAATANGRVVDLIESEDSDFNTVFKPVFEFVDEQGEPHRFASRTTSSPAPYEIGDDVKVFYPVDAPEKAVEDAFFTLWGYPAIALLFATLMLGEAVGTLRRRRQAARAL